MWFQKISARYLIKGIFSSIFVTRNKSNTILEKIKSNPYYEKYETKIISKEIENDQIMTTKLDDSDKESRMEIKKQRLISNEMNLNDIMKLDKIYEMNSDDVKRIWKEYYKDKNVIVETVNKVNFCKLKARGDLYRNFVLPLTRQLGYEFFFLEFFKNTIYLTPLIQYQTHRENAPICLKITYFTELLEIMGIVLMKADFDKTILNAQEAQYLLNQIHLYYCSDENDSKLDLLRQLNENPNEFNYKNLITELEQN